MSLVYLGSAAVIAALIRQRERHGIDTVGLVLSSAILAVFPTVLVWALLFR